MCEKLKSFFLSSHIITTPCIMSILYDRKDVIIAYIIIYIKHVYFFFYNI